MKRHKIYFLLIISILCYFGLIGKSYAINKESKICKNVYIENIDVSGLTKSEAVDKINRLICKSNNINLFYKDKNYNLKLEDIGFYYKVEEVIKKAYEVGRNKDILSDIKTKMNLYLGEKVNFKLYVGYEKNKLETYIFNLAKDIYVSPIDSEIKLNENKFKVSYEKNGIEVNKKELFTLLDKKIINKDYSKCYIPTSIITPKYTFEKLSKINTILGTYETEFNSKNKNRVNNITIATNKINNTLIDSNEKFSFNETTGKRDIEQGFKEAPIILNGKLELGMGGGICQVSSTIYNAALYSGLEIIQAKNHSIPSSYIQKGRDATVSYGNIDLIFENKFDSPILIQSKVENNKIISTIYGNHEDKKYIDIKTNIVETIPQEIIVKRSDKLYEGKTKVGEKGRRGYKVNTYRIYKNEDGSINKEELINECYYPPKNKVIVKGTKKKHENLNRTNIKII
ncbi:VanW family protein [[Eubacterium] tenue]|nr:VanW family protein [[Eubacterium] tenue]MBC8631370.1 VanW family protein [[Eubacterium] tenue]